MSRLEGLEACGWPPLLDAGPEGPDEWHPDEDCAIGLPAELCRYPYCTSGDACLHPLDVDLDLDYNQNDGPDWAGGEELPWTT